MLHISPNLPICMILGICTCTVHHYTMDLVKSLISYLMLGKCPINIKKTYVFRFEDSKSVIYSSTFLSINASSYFTMHLIMLQSNMSNFYGILYKRLFYTFLGDFSLSTPEVNSLSLPVPT